MKVIVRCANNRVTKADMEREIERLFQENKDLRVQVGHLRDELNLSQQQSEARRQVICERDQRIQELEESLEKNTHLRETSITKMAEIQTKLYEQMREAVHAGAEINVELMEADATINEQKKRIEWLEEEVARLTNERDTAVRENTALTFDVNDLRDKCEVERNLRVEAEKAYDQVASEAYDMHQKIVNLTVDNTRLENKVEELEAEVDTCHHNIDGYIEGNRRMRAEYEKKLETEQDQTKHWHKKYDDLKENYDELIQLHREWGEEIDRLRKVIIELQTNRFTTDEFIGMIMKNFMPSADK
jgi:chromosome segregation ATPase